MKLTINGAEINLTPKPVSLRNATLLTSWATKARDHVVATNREGQQKFFVDLTSSHPEILELMTLDGELNPKSIRDFVERDKQGIERANQNLEEGQTPLDFNEEQSYKDAVAHVQKSISDMMKDTPSIAKVIQFSAPSFGEDMASFLLGVECIVNTYDDSKYDQETNAAIKNTDAEHWQEVTAPEVAQYMNTFLGRYS